MNKEITLTQQEIEDIKDETKFRTKVILQLKGLNGIPDRVNKVETKVLMLMWGIPVAVGLLFAVLRVWAR